MVGLVAQLADLALKEGRTMFLFAKKNQKTFSPAGTRRAGCAGYAGRHGAMVLGSFSQNRTSSLMSAQTKG
jgi:hypothetical protein